MIKFRSEISEIFITQEEILEKIQTSLEKIDKLTPHMEVCSNKECVGENPICDHAKYMVKEIQAHNDLIKSLIQEYIYKYPEGEEFLHESTDEVD